jgi:multiple sugar transport system ATP-binding protein
MAEKHSGVEVRDLCKMFDIGDVQACKYVNLEIDEGEFMVLLGPSGCGKTTTLRCIAGLERPDNEDAIWIKGKNITNLPPKDRNLAFVFQDTMLFPHLTVRRNISFGLDMRKIVAKEKIDRRIREVSEMLHLEPMLDRKPSQLSGGQAQRVALGRAIVMEPDAFLMDEPLANLDAALRVEMRTEIKRVQRKLTTSTIFVTHDQEEALSLGDKIAVMNEGAVQQVGTPHEIYHDPANVFVVRFKRKMPKPW